ncbi:LacI family DNA-binding transcriptional regulator [Corynebacterium poyangense]|uniref:LacI family DNA-binding transcriptional regulator n=1 Tax=Corynebacterium poyangense TaxID=2684405 RepID=A0A7H0SRK1_9CORY|nr:LacI family DNA-binding transcriptional regulator [Corynebacterium poyangense]MBZ8176607.1 substrate-binding domain-containing protein [Corynebacterium poyangense]QNQ91176.1 LacI family DNA-binding transcriptional regulator [Corynebacterium poyangense]
MPQRSTPTLKELARLAGVSVSTISRALANNPAIAPATREKIQRLAKEQGYRPNAQARALQSRRSGSIGLIVPSLVNSYFATMATQVQAEAMAHGLNTLIVNANENPDTLNDLLDNLSHHQVDGVLCVPLEESRDRIEQLASTIPVVLIDRDLPDSQLYSVTSDPAPGMRSALKLLKHHHLLPLGYLSGPMSTSTGRERLTVFQQGCVDYEIDDPRIFLGGYEQQRGLEDALTLLKQGVRTLFAGDSMMTIGVLQACHRHRLRIPHDVAVVGFDRHPAFELQQAPITVIDQHVSDMATLAFRILIGVMADNPPDQRRTYINTTLITRESTQCL